MNCLNPTVTVLTRDTNNANFKKTEKSPEVCEWSEDFMTFLLKNLRWRFFPFKIAFCRQSVITSKSQITSEYLRFLFENQTWFICSLINSLSFRKLIFVNLVSFIHLPANSVARVSRMIEKCVNPEQIKCKMILLEYMKGIRENDRKMNLKNEISNYKDEYKSFGTDFLVRVPLWDPLKGFRTSKDSRRPTQCVDDSSSSKTSTGSSFQILLREPSKFRSWKA